MEEAEIVALESVRSLQEKSPFVRYPMMAVEDTWIVVLSHEQAVKLELGCSFQNADFDSCYAENEEIRYFG